MNELVVKTNEFTLPKIKWNENDVKEAVDSLVKKYDGIEFNEEQLPIAKKDLASIRKVKKNLNNEKKKVKKAWNENYTMFEDTIKSYMGKIDDVINDVDNQVKTFEQRLNDEREAEIKAFDEWQDIKDFVEFDNNLLLKKWTDKKLKENFVELKEEIDRGIKIIKQTATLHNLDADFYIQKLKHQSLDLVVERITEDATNLTKQEPQEVQVDTSEKVVTITRKLSGTITALKTLKGYAEQLGVDWAVGK